MLEWIAVGFVLGAFTGSMVATFVLCCFAVNSLEGKEKHHG